MFVVIGSTNVDLFIYGPEQRPHREMDEFTSDNLAFCDEPLTVTLGGNGANTAYVLGRLGAPVALCATVGRDALGDLIASWLSDAGVDTSALVRDPAVSTSSTTVIMDAARNRQCFHHRGGNATHGLWDTPPELLLRANGLLITSYPLLLRWRPDGVRAALATAKAAAAITALDIGPTLGPPVTVDEISGLTADLDYLIANEHELATCTGEKDVGDGIDRLLGACAECVIIKRGNRGALFQRRGDRHSTSIPGFPVDSRSTIGAGDSFNAGFLYALGMGSSTAEAVRFANAVASLVVQAEQGALGAPTVGQVGRLFEAHSDDSKGPAERQ
ncbi:MAG TPA: carbohydrate kinase family protein [Rhodothermales bacterium]|nr:carbohydrate kinase family protein [Rhodothermales bacterium]